MVVDGAVVVVVVGVGTIVVVVGGAGTAGGPVVSASVGEHAATETEITNATARSRIMGPTLSMLPFWQV